MKNYLNFEGLSHLFNQLITLFDKKADKDDYYGIAREEGSIVSAKSLEGLGINTVSYINFVQNGTGDPSPDNIRAISGWDAVEVNRTGKNIFGGLKLAEKLKTFSDDVVIDEIAKTAKYHASYGGGKRLYDKFKPNTQYTIIITLAPNSTGNTANFSCYYTDGTNNRIEFDANNRDTTVKRQLVFTSIAGKSIKSITGVNMSGTQYWLYDECGIFEGAITAEEYVPYEGEALTAELPETVYGGILDWNTGILTITWVFQNVFTLNKVLQTDDGTMNYLECLLDKPNYSKAYLTAMCNKYPTHKAISKPPTYGYIRVMSNKLLIYDENIDTTTLANNQSIIDGLQVCYELATPETYQLTPQQLKAINGYNYIWSNSGNTCATFNCASFDNVIGSMNHPVESVNGKTGAIVLEASDVGAATETHTHLKSEIIDFEDIVITVTDDGKGNVTLGGISSATIYETRLNSLETDVATLNSDVGTLNSVINNNDILVANI